MNTNNLMKIVEVTKKLTTIVLEDEPETNEMMCNTLENFFDKVYSALDGETALELYEKHQPDVIFIDIILPGRSGLKIAKKIRDINPKQIIIIVSGSNDMGHISKAVKLGVNNFIRKPIDTDKMIDVLDNIVYDIKRERKEFRKILKKRLKKELEKELKKPL
jgi:two-component system nitrogen regulation response regulator NtrX